jgi:hypothetical protein
MHRPLTLLTALTVASRLSAQTPGEAVLQRMHDAYAGKWYHTLRFVQKTTQYRPDGTANIATWYESLRHTARGVELRIDLGDPSAGNGILYTADSAWVIRDGKVAQTRGEGNEFLPLIEGVYVQPVARTMRELSTTKVDFSRVTRATWQGKAASVIGVSSASDSTSPQIWVDDERNVLVRMILSPAPGAPVMDIRLDDYVKTGGGWLATKIVMLVGGKPRQTEDYADWKVDIDLPANLFNVSAWTPSSHWAKR